MINLENWMPAFLRGLDNTFGNRVWFVGLQGSYSRGEATDESDIDPVVILDELSAADISAYREMLDTVPNRELICGFLSGKEEILSWDPADLFQFCHDTTPIRGSLEEVLALIGEDSVTRAIKTGVCSIYHGCVHNMLHGRSENTLLGLYKAASFAVQAIAFLETGTYTRQLKELLKTVSFDERTIIENFLQLKDRDKVDFEQMSEELFAWAKKRIVYKG